MFESAGESHVPLIFTLAICHLSAHGPSPCSPWLFYVAYVNLSGTLVCSHQYHRPHPGLINIIFHGLNDTYSLAGSWPWALVRNHFT